MMPTDQPRNETQPGAVVPLFPLPDMVLFPGVLLPLHIFEPRYCQLVNDLLDVGGNLVVGALLGKNQSELATPPRVEPLAGIGQVENYQQLEDGRYLILLRGMARVRIQEVPSNRMYRKVTAHPIEEQLPTSAEDEESLRKDLIQAIKARSEQDIDLPDGVHISQLVDLLLLQLQLEPDLLYHHYAVLDVTERALGALLLHEERGT